MTANLSLVLQQLGIESLDELCTFSVKTLKNYGEAKLNLLIDVLRSYLWQEKILPGRIKEVYKLHLPIEVLEMDSNLQHFLKVTGVKTVTEFIQLDAANQLTLSWTSRDRMAVRLRVFCLMALSIDQLKSLKRAFTLESSPDSTLSEEIFPASKYSKKSIPPIQSKELSPSINTFETQDVHNQVGRKLLEGEIEITTNPKCLLSGRTYSLYLSL